MSDDLVAERPAKKRMRQDDTATANAPHKKPTISPGEEQADAFAKWTEHEVVYRARVGDRMFRLGTRVLRAAGPESLLAQMVPLDDAANKEVFFDRSASLFARILDYLRTRTVPKYSRSLLADARYYKIERLVQALLAKRPAPQPPAFHAPPVAGLLQSTSSLTRWLANQRS